MNNFTFYNPVKIVFGKGSIAKLASLVGKDQKIMMLYGGGSIKKNGVYEQVLEALKEHQLIEFPGIEPNPQYDTCVKAVELARAEKVDFLLSVGGGSVLDATKFIAAATLHNGEAWDLMEGKAKIQAGLSLGGVLTLPATGSEMNSGFVISRSSTGQKLGIGSPLLYPKFSILDPESTYSLPERQVANGIVDSFVHVTEQYLTYDVNSPLQNRQAEAVLKTLIEEGPKVKKDPKNYDIRANLMWCATHALNGVLSCGVAEDWATHMIGHELTAFHGLDHAQSLAVVLPSILRHQKENKRNRLLHYAREVWGIQEANEDLCIEQAIVKTENFFHEVGMPTTLKAYDLKPEDCEGVVQVLKERGWKLGEHKAIQEKEIKEILSLAA